MQGKEVTETNTRHRIYGRGKGFPRMYNGHPCVLDAIRIILSSGTTKAKDIATGLQGMGCIPGSIRDPLHYVCNILSTSAKKGFIRREKVGFYQLRPGDTKPVHWFSKNQHNLNTESAIVVTKGPAVRAVKKHRSPPAIRIEGTNGQSQSARRLRGKLDFCWPGTERSLFTVKFEIYPSDQSL